ncbi:hypothetical protein D9756_006981 [Leucocoprinus leucothites]|uniref:Uncharacterized protein n=1 Tax=Leucocoprinus leucothites TaxID=201217 RepID=A0A8H5FZ26_9AGAR|nr:hypothetical protein D9756_006981 [Leucoagaricus leucothites]
MFRLLNLNATLPTCQRVRPLSSPHIVGDTTVIASVAAGQKISCWHAEPLSSLLPKIHGIIAFLHHPLLKFLAAQPSSFYVQSLEIGQELRGRHAQQHLVHQPTSSLNVEGSSVSSCSIVPHILTYPRTRAGLWNSQFFYSAL